jgi:hypothetical protein
VRTRCAKETTMMLPIDARRAPFKPKYIEDETSMFNKWMQFGTDPGDGTHHVSDANNDVIVGLTNQQAIRLVEARRIFVDEVLNILNGIR